jgi:hypothetical protein
MADTPHLDRLLAQAAPDSTPAPDPEDWDEADWDEVRDHLAASSPWFAQIMNGENPGDPPPPDE